MGESQALGFGRVAALSCVIGLGASTFVVGLAAPAGADFVVNGCTIVASPTPAVHTVCPGTDLQGLDGSGVNLSFANLSGANLSNVNATNAQLTRANLTDADLTGANVKFALVSGANFTHATLVNTNASNALFTQANFTSANLSGAVASNALFHGANFTSANLTGAMVKLVDLTAANLTNANLTNVVATNAVATNTNATHVNLTGASVTGLLATGINLSHANLTRVNGTGANLTKANLTGAIITGANESGANLAGATLSGVVSGALVGAPAKLPTGYRISAGYLIGPGVSLVKAALSGAPLAGANLVNANLSGANASGANLTRANLTNANLTRANFSSANLTGLVLTGAIGIPWPSAPTAMTVVSGDGQVTLSWSAPKRTGASAITKYVVTPVFRGIAQTPQTFASDATTGFVTGLIDKRTYSFTMSATNGNGTGGPSSPPVSVIVGSPAPPTDVMAVLGDPRSLTVSFTEPAANGSAIVSYTATCTSPNGGATKFASAPASPVTVSGLTEGVSYICTVTATNSRGTGLPSARSAIATT